MTLVSTFSIINLEMVFFVVVVVVVVVCLLLLVFFLWGWVHILPY